MSRYTGMRHVLLKEDIATRVQKYMRAGLIKEPAWLKEWKRHPPLPAPWKSTAPKITLPTDRLQRIRQRDHPTNEPFFAHGQLQSATLLFAQRQWDLMQSQSISEAEAYRRVEDIMKHMKAESLAQVQSLTADLKAAGADAAQFTQGELADQLSQWQAKLEDKAWEEWPIEHQVGLDHWLTKSILGWDWEQERYLKDDDFHLALAQLRSTVFPSIAAPPEPMAEGEAEEDVGFLEDDPEIAERVNDWFTKHGAWQTKVYQNPDFDSWNKEERNELDTWILNHCLSSVSSVTGPAGADAGADAGTGSGGSEGGGVQMAGMEEGEKEELLARLEELEAMRWHLFPRLDPRETDKTADRLDLAPEVHEVIRLVKNLRQDSATYASTSTTGYTAASGLDAIRSFKSLGESVPAGEGTDGAAGKAGETGSPGLENMPEYVKAKIAEEQAVIEQARRDQRWLDREIARETNVEEEWLKRQEAEKEAFLAWIDSVVPPDPTELTEEPADQKN